MAVSLTTAQVIYAAQSKLLELADIVEQSISFRRVKNEIKIGEALLRYIRVLQTDTTLTVDEQTAICQHMINIGNLYDFPASPTTTVNAIFNFSANAEVGPQGPQGIPGQDGGGTDYNQFALTTTTTVDSFDITDADAVEWTYRVKDGANLRSGRIGACWLSDGSSIAPYHYSTIDIGTTAGINFTVDYSAGLIRLRAVITSGTWDVSGTRYFIPNNGAGVIVQSTALQSGKILIGNLTNEAEARTVSGDITLNYAGVAAISPGVITNGDISSVAAIALSKLATLTADRALISSSAGVITASTISTTKLGYLTDVTSNIQAQLDSKIGSATGAISTVVSSDLSPNKVLISTAAGKIGASSVSDTALSYIGSLTSDAQAQINSKQATITGAASSVVSANLTASKIVVSDVSGKIASGTIDPATIVTVESGTPQLAKKEIQIGDWNMDTTGTITIAHGLDYTKIREVSAWIIQDGGTVRMPLTTIDSTGAGTIGGGVLGTSSTTSTIQLGRTVGGRFDNVNYSSIGFNRGYIVITYEV